ncbi:hypothetical protein Droror1_Dr00006799 [Drosera rotundifolia]
MMKTMPAFLQTPTPLSSNQIIQTNSTHHHLLFPNPPLGQHPPQLIHRIPEPAASGSSSRSSSDVAMATAAAMEGLAGEAEVGEDDGGDAEKEEEECDYEDHD